MAWVLTRGLTTVRAEFNTVFPKRDKKSDGTIGDAAHARGTSGHNNENSGHAEFNDHDGIDEVRAWDADSDLNSSVTMADVIRHLVEFGRAGGYLPFRYIIFNQVIYRKSTGWKAEDYTGPSPHTEHAHFSGDYNDKADNWTGSLGLASLVKGKEPRKVKYEYFNAHLPVIPYGHNDAQGIVGTDGKSKDTTTYVRRIQRVLQIKADGIYGNDTKAAIRKLEIPGRDGSVVDLVVWTRLYALWGSKLTKTS